MSAYEYTVNGITYRCEVSHKLNYSEQESFRKGFEQMISRLKGLSDDIKRQS